MKIETNHLNPALLTQPDAMPTVTKSMKMEKVEEAARDFEAMFLTEMLKPMFESVGVNKMFGGGKGEEIYRSFMTDEYGKMLSQTGNIGIADLVKEQLIEMQARADQENLA